MPFSLQTTRQCSRCLQAGCSRRAHISQLGRGPDASDQHGTSDGPDHLRPLPNPLPRTETLLVSLPILILSWPKAYALLSPNYQTVQSLPPGRMFKTSTHLPSPYWGAGGEGNTEVAISPPTPLGVVPRLLQLRHQHIGKIPLNLDHAILYRTASATALFQLLAKHCQLRGF